MRMLKKWRFHVVGDDHWFAETVIEIVVVQEVENVVPLEIEIAVHLYQVIENAVPLEIEIAILLEIAVHWEIKVPQQKDLMSPSNHRIPFIFVVCFQPDWKGICKK